MSAIPEQHWTATQYLAFERDSDEKHEFFDHDVYLMTGASENHNLIVANLIISLGTQLRGTPCKLYPSDMRVCIAALDSYTYPDVSVVCGEAAFEDERRDSLLNPTLLIEVLSPSTEKYDRGRKFRLYRALDSLQDYLLISQTNFHVEYFQLQPNGHWMLIEAEEPTAIVELPSIRAALTLNDIYDRIVFADSR